VPDRPRADQGVLTKTHEEGDGYKESRQLRREFFQFMYHLRRSGYDLLKQEQEFLCLFLKRLRGRLGGVHHFRHW
jgi:hypothetical protein